MLIDVSYSTLGPRHVESVSVAGIPSPQSPAVNEVVNGYIKASQPKFFRNAVSMTLPQATADYSELIEREREDSSNEADISEEKEGPQSGYAILYKKLCEPFADYTFYHILRDTNAQAIITGFVRLKCANEYVAPLKR